MSGISARIVPDRHQRVLGAVMLVHHADFTLLQAARVTGLTHGELAALRRCFDLMALSLNEDLREGRTALLSVDEVLEAAA